MQFTGKNLLLANLGLVLMTKFASACSYNPEFREQVERQWAEREFNTKLFFFSTIFLITANIVLFFVRNKKYYWLLVTIVLVILFSAPITIIVGAVDMCGDSKATGLQANFVIFMSFFIYQVLLWVNRTSLQFKKGKITTINLR